MNYPILTVAISSRALFALEEEHELFVRQGAIDYARYMVAHEDEILEPGPAFPLVQALLQLPDHIQVLVMSKNSADVSLRIFRSIESYGLDITRAVLTTGASIAPYLKAFHVDLYLSADEEDVRAAIACGVAAGLVQKHSAHEEEAITPEDESHRDRPQIRIAFDGDAVLFSDEAEQIFQNQGVEAFCENERMNAKNPLPKGPFANLLRTVSQLQKEYPIDQVPIKTALVTARSAPAHERVIRTLRSWGVRMDEAFFLGGMDKDEVLEAFDADIFFDDSEMHTKKAANVVLAARVPYGINDQKKVV